MRTTVTLEPDVVEALRAIAHERGISFKDAINTVVRAGVATERAARPYRVTPRSMGRPGVDLTHAAAVLDQLDDEDYLRRRDAAR
jgi:hypothetical protein